MKIQDTLTGKEKELDNSGNIRIYLCGVTVYDESHIGHARTIIVFDVLRRYLESIGNKVELIQNFTDVDDKIILRAKRENLRVSAISSRYIEHYHNDFDALNVNRASKYPKATEHIQDMQKLIQDLVDKKIAYKTKNGVYFSVSKFPEYGKLSKKKIDDLMAGARVEIDKEKDNPLDFALWKFSNDDPAWDSPWGRGRPGWHIECSTMSIKYLGENFEIHGGGRDLIFPHHENEIAQSESFTKKPFAKIWMHVGMITIDGEKMSKSKGNIKSIQHVLENWGSNIIRLFCLTGHYSKPIDYSEELLKENVVKWHQVESCYYELKQAQREGTAEEIKKIISECQNEFNSALNDDFNTHLALNAFFKLVKEVNRMASAEMLTKSLAEEALPTLEKFLNILGLVFTKKTEDEKNVIKELGKKREKQRKEKKYEEADKTRAQLFECDCVCVDHEFTTTYIIHGQIKSDR